MGDTHWQLVVRSALRSRVHSHENRRRAKDLVWRWVGKRWPRLMPTASVLEGSEFERRFPGQRLSLSTDADGAVWVVEVTHTEKNSPRTWTTRAAVADMGDADLLTLQTACSGLAAAPAVIAPPKLLSAWVDGLDLDDGHAAVIGEPRMVTDAAELDGFCDHVMHEKRALPVIALANKPNSRFYGVDPRGLAEAVRGLAHVVCLTPELAANAAPRLGRNLVPVPGAARIYRLNFRPAAAASEHPIIRPAAFTAGEATDPGELRRHLCRLVCAMSVGLATTSRLN
jgi:hypothetical protein